MTLWIRYETFDYSFWHKITDKPKLVDKTCCTLHEHNPITVVVDVEDFADDFLDFKDVKMVVNDLLALARGSGDGKEITLNDILKTEDATMEKFILWLQHRIKIKVDIKVKLARRIRIFIQETPKYGMVLDYA